MFWLAKANGAWYKALKIDFGAHGNIFDIFGIKAHAI